MTFPSGDLATSGEEKKQIGEERAAGRLYILCLCVCCQEKLFVFLRAQIGGGRWLADLEGKAWKRPRAMWGRKKLRASREG